MVGYEAELANPQVFPDDNLIYPFSPHDSPHEFLMIHSLSELYPTRVTP
jgi:hypothetical protein